jgi:proteasome lid subunit RPN8/RPN11
MTDTVTLLARADLREPLFAHAAVAFPKEACGLLLDGPSGPEAVLAENLADRYHALDPEGWPRTAETAYILDPRLIADAERAGKRLVAIVHSHCRVGAYFSAEDIRQASSPFDDGPLYPGVDYLVLDVQEAAPAGRVASWKVFRWSDDATAFIEAAAGGPDGAPAS